MEKTELENIEQINLSVFDNEIYIIRILTNHELLYIKVVKQ